MKDEICIKFGAKLFQAEESAEIDTGRQEWSWCVWEKKPWVWNRIEGHLKDTGLENFKEDIDFIMKVLMGRCPVLILSTMTESLQLDVFLSYVF